MMYACKGPVRVILNQGIIMGALGIIGAFLLFRIGGDTTIGCYFEQGRKEFFSEGGSALMTGTDMAKFS